MAHWNDLQASCERSGWRWFPPGIDGSCYPPGPQSDRIISALTSGSGFVGGEKGITFNGVLQASNYIALNSRDAVDEARRAATYKPVGGFLGDVVLPLTPLIIGVASGALGLSAYLAAGSLAQQLEQSARSNMSLNLGGLLGTVGGVIGGINTSGFGDISKYIGAGLQIAGSAFTPAPAPAYPVASNLTYGPAPSYPTSPVRPAMSMAPVIASGGRAIVAMTAPILYKIWGATGRRMSLTAAISTIRKMGKILLDPTAIAVALGISVGELATLITANAGRKTRHMNAANGKALRRAARRIKSFHRMCGTIDLLKSRGRRVASSRCGTCKRSPCRC